MNGKITRQTAGQPGRNRTAGQPGQTRTAGQPGRNRTAEQTGETPGDLLRNHTTALECVAVTQRFGNVTALNNVDLCVQRGAVTALLGPNGAGKTTLIDIALGLVPPKSGTVELFGMSPRRAVRCGRVGASQQSGQVPENFTVRGVLEAVGKAWSSHVEIPQLLQLMELTHLAKRKVKKLSGGEQQRVRTALALLSNPDLLFLDEPTTGMDVNARIRFWEVMHEFAAQGRTILFATHYLSEAQDFASDIVILKAGQVIAHGTPAQIQANAVAHLRANVPDAAHEQLRRELLDTARGRNWQIQFTPDAVQISGSELDDAARVVLASAGACNLTLERASLDEAFTAITTAEN